MRTAAAVVKEAICWALAFIVGWFPYVSDTPEGRRGTKHFFGWGFLLLAVFFAVQREWELVSGMVGLSAASVGGLLVADFLIVRYDRADRTRENVRRTAMRRRIAEEQAAAARHLDR